MAKANRDAAIVVGPVGSGNEIEEAIAEAEALLAHQQGVRDKLIKLQSEIYGTAAAYDNGVIIAGYVAFFALWAGTAKDLSHLCRLATVALMGTSLMFYMGWHIIQMLTRQRYEFKMADVFKSAEDPERFNREWAETAQKQDIATVRLMRFWPYVFVPALASGFAAGAVLTYNALAVMFGWSQLAS
jgi:hypothetical protein